MSKTESGDVKKLSDEQIDEVSGGLSTQEMTRITMQIQQKQAQVDMHKTPLKILSDSVKKDAEKLRQG